MPLIENISLDQEMERFEKDMQWIYNNYETLKRQHPNEFVAVFDQQLVAHSADIEGLIKALRPQYGDRDLAIKFIYAEPPNTVLESSPRP